MRVADRAVARNYLKYFHGAQSKYAETIKRVYSGNRFTKLSDDVSAGSRVLRSRMEMYKAEKQLENTKEANDELRIAEDALMSINDLLKHIHEHTVVRAENDPTGDEGRKVYATEIRAYMDEIIQHANVKYGNKFSFGGTNSFVAPFTVGANGKMLYNGIPVDEITYDSVTGQYVDASGDVVPMDKDIFYDIDLGIKMSGPQIVSSTAFKVSYSGLDVFGCGVDADGISNNVYNVLYEVQKNIDEFDRETLEKWNAKLGKLMEAFRSNLTDIGVKTQYLLDTERRLEDKIDQHRERIHDLMGSDEAEEATNEKMNDYVLKAVLQMGSKILPLSLMDFIR
jgi:flagellar hook-associated protein 3 FlgL